MLGKIERKLLMVEDNFQKKVMGRLMVISLLGIVIMSLIIYFLANEEIERTFFSIHQGVRHTWHALMPAIFLGGGLTLLITSFAVYYVTLYQSHRIGGPVYRFTKVMEELEKGNLAQSVNIRRGDYMSELAESLERALSSNRNKLTELKKEAAFLTTRLSDDNRLNPDGGGGKGVHGDEVSASLTRVNEILEFFRVS